jgi:soluble lytic murein transglycosylase
MDGAIGWWWWERQREHRFDAQILAIAQRFNMDPALIKAVVWRESRFDPKALGSAGEMGLMQIRPITAQEWALANRVQGFQPEHLWNPPTNLMIGTWYLKKLMSRYLKSDDPVPYALADYNAGRSRSRRWVAGPAATNSSQFIAQIGFPTTQLYVQEVSQRIQHYQREWAGLSQTKP